MLRVYICMYTHTYTYYMIVTMHVNICTHVWMNGRMESRKAGGMHVYLYVATLVRMYVCK